MQGILDYFGPGGNLISKELNKGQTAFGQAILEWQPTRASWTVTVANPPATLQVNGREIAHGLRVVLSHLDVITVGAVNARFLRVPAPPSLNWKPCNEVILGPKKLLIGRAEGESAGDTNPPGAERWNLDYEDRSISKVHVEIQHEAAGFIIYDRSRAGTYLNGSVFQPRPLVAGDRFNIGCYFFEFTGTAIQCVDQVSGARVEGRNLVVDVRHDAGRKRILKNLSIEIKAGEFLGVLGGSGQGKSTLMNLLAGLSAASQGQVIMDGTVVTAGGWRAGTVGYVPQDDIVHHELTVREAITLTAKLRLSVPGAAIDALVSGILQRLGLENQANQPIKSLSGGQRKRVNIGTELLARPPVLYLDEPTSGLDPENEESVVATLQNLRLTGQTVVCTTHSLHKAYLFDRIAFIHDGRLMFLGTQDEARHHFLEIKDATGTESSGPSVKLERIYKLLSQQSDAEKWEQKFNASPLAPFRPHSPPPPRRVVAASRRAKRPGFFKTLAVLVQTQWRVLSADPRNWQSLLMQAILIGLLAGWVGRDDPEFRFFACLIATLWFGCSNAAQAIVRELPIFRRERVAGLGLHPYILSKTAFLSLIAWAQVVLLLAAQAIPVAFSPYSGNPATDMLPQSRSGLLLFALAFALAGIVGVKIGLSISALARTVTQATLWVPLVLIPQIIFSGFVVPLPEMPTTARIFSHAIPSAGAQRLLDAGNVADKRLPLMTEKTEVPLFFWTKFEKKDGDWDIRPGTNANKLVPQDAKGRGFPDKNFTYRELDEYSTAWQNLATVFASVGYERNQSHSEQYNESESGAAAASDVPNEPVESEDKGAAKNSDAEPYLFQRNDVFYKAGQLGSFPTEIAMSALSLLAWIAACYGIVFAGLSFSQPETLRPAWARPRSGSRR